MVITGTLPALRGALLFPPQMLGGMVAAGLVSAMFPGPLAVQTTLTGGTSIVQGLFIEMFLTAELVFTVLMLAAEKTKATFIAPVGIGLALFVAELAGMCFSHRAVYLSPFANVLERCVLYGRFPQSHSILRPMRGRQAIPGVPLDLLVGTFPRCYDIRRILQIC